MLEYFKKKKFAGRVNEPKCTAVSHLASRISVTKFDDLPLLFKSFLEKTQQDFLDLINF